MNKAVFLDRDGVVNKGSEHYYVYQPKDFELNEGVGEFIKTAEEKGYLIIVISNQSGIAKGEYSVQEADQVHEYCQQLLSEFNTKINEFYYCTHHPGYTKCLCRKPHPLMIQKAMARFNIDPKQSILFGDQHRDVESAEAAGIKGIKIETDKNLMKYNHLI